MNSISSYKRLNNILGWVVFIIALAVYTLTMEKTGSFWDCGEFISGAYKLQVVHPPGAPLFILIGRIFSLFAFGDVTKIALMVNFLSAVSTAFVALFCFWSTTAIVRKFLLKEAKDYVQGNILAVLGSGLVAGLTCTFMDSLWFSAAEGEVYALSMFFMTFVVWAIMKWDADDSPRADRWLVLIAFMIGLSTGVHLLSMLVVPFAAIIIYYKKFKPTLLGLAAAFGSSFIVIGLIMKGMISGIPSLYTQLELLLVNGMGMGFNTGVTLGTILIILALVSFVIVTDQTVSERIKNIAKITAITTAIIIIFLELPNIFGGEIKIGLAGIARILGILISFGIFLFTKKVNIRKLLNTAAMCVLVMVIGYSSFMIVPIRSTANTPINMNRPSDPFTMLSYLNREQYGERPLIKGPAYNVDQYDLKRENGGVVKEGLSTKYSKGTDEYDVVGEKYNYTFESQDMMLFPRLGVWQDDAKLEGYRAWLRPDFAIYDRESKKEISVFENKDFEMARAYVKQMNAENETAYGSSRYRLKDKVTMGDNISYFVNYQIGYMYMRYFMWNFSGRQNDAQGTYANSEGGWITGINAIDDNITLWGNPSWQQSNLSPIREANMANNKFYAIPFLLGLIGIFFLFKANWKLGTALMVMFLTTGVIFIIYSNQPPIEPRERDYTLVGSFFAYAIWIGIAVAGIFVGLRSKLNGQIAAIGATAICLIAPFLMGTQGWDDHNRSGRTTAIDFATNYLESCAPNAIIFTQGDNDTYPLWYAQEVEEVRLDVRIINLSLLGVDWYVNQLRYKMNDADPIKMTFTPDMIRASNRDYIRFMANPSIDATKYYNAQDIMNFIAKDDPGVEAQLGDPYYLPTKKISIPVSEEAIASMEMVNLSDTNIAIQPNLQVDLRKSNLMKNDLLTVDIVANNINERPIYFAVSVSPSAYLGFQKYFQQEGLTYRVVPVVNPSGEPTGSPIRTDVMYDNMMNKFAFGMIGENEDIYLDENILRMTMNMVSNFSKLAQQLVREGENEKAVAIVDKCLAELPTDKVPFNFFHSDLPEIYIKAGEEEKARALSDKMVASCKAELDYFVLVFQDRVEDAKNSGNSAYLEKLAQGSFTQNRDITEMLYILQQLQQTYTTVDTDFAVEISEILNEYSAKLSDVNTQAIS